MVELLESLAHNCFNNPFSTDSGDLAKNIHLFDGLNGKHTTATQHIIDFTTYPSHATQDRTIYDLLILSVLYPASSLSISTLSSQNIVSKAKTR